MTNSIKKINLKKTTSSVVLHLVLAGLSIMWLIPIVWLVFNAFCVDQSTYYGSLFPKTWGFDNFSGLFSNSRYMFGRWFLNTIIVSVFTCLLSSAFVLMISYALSRLRFKFRKTFMRIALILGMFPGFMAMFAIYFLLKFLGLGGTLFALVLAYSAAAGLGYYIVKGFMDTVPRSLDEAAKLDGATNNRVFFSMIIPMSKPIIVYTLLMAFLAPWFDFVFVAVLMRDNKESYTIAYGLWDLMKASTEVGVDSTANYYQFFAGAVIVASVITGLYVALQKYYIAGITGGLSKG